MKFQNYFFSGTLQKVMLGKGLEKEKEKSANIIIHSMMSNCQRRKQLPFTVKQLQTIQDNNDYVHSMILLSI